MSSASVRALNGLDRKDSGGPTGFETVAEGSAVLAESDRETFAEEDSVMQGWLLKRGKMVKTWKKRFFRLETGLLQYFVSPGGELKGEWNLIGIDTKITPRDDMECPPLTGVEHYVWEVTIGDDTPERPLRTLYLCARQPDETAEWIKSLNSEWVDREGNTAAMLYAEQGRAEELMAICEIGTEVCLQNMHGTTALMEAAAKGDTECLRILLDHGAEIDTQSITGNTALMSAIRMEEIPAMRFLLEAGADVNLPADDGSSCALLAIQGGHTGGTQEAALQLLIESGMDLRCGNMYGVTPLMIAAQRGMLECVRMLLAANVPINEAQQSTGNTAPYFAVRTAAN
jgi:hypothetical protein